MKNCNIAILGATGAVGREMLNVLEEYDIPVSRLKLLSSARSAGSKIPFRGEDLTVEEATDASFEGMDFVLGAVKSGMSRAFAPSIVKSGAVYIDNSSAFRMDPAIPLVVPEINGEDAKSNSGIIANPNCSTIITAMAVGALNRLSPIESMVACTYQAVSGADNLYTNEEMKMQNEGRKILHLPGLRVTCTCVRVPVMRSHSIAVTVRTKEKITVAEANEAIRAFPGCRLIEDYEGRCYPTPLDTSGQDLVWVGRVREDLTQENALTLWCCGDQIRKGAASNAVQILKYLL